MTASQTSRVGKKWLRLGLRALAVLVVGASIFVATRSRPVAVELASVERGTLRVTLDEEGETRVRDRYVVSAPFAGRVLRIELEPGDPVLARQTVLATFEAADPALLDARSEAQAGAQVRATDAALGRARAERERAVAELGFAETDLRRIERLFEQQVVPEDRLEQARLAERRARESLAAADFAVEAAVHQLEMARAGLLQVSGRGGKAPLALTSPIDGVVLRRLRESEAVVPAGEPLVEVADPSRLEIVSDYLSTDAVQIEVGATVSIEQWGGEGPLAGRVRRVEPAGFTKISALGVEEQRVNVIIDLDDPGSPGRALGDGFRVEVRVVVYEVDDALRVPTSALFRIADGWAVFAVEEDTARQVPVRLGRRNSFAAEVLSGLAPGQKVVVHPPDSVTDGVEVRARSLESD